MKHLCHIWTTRSRITCRKVSGMICIAVSPLKLTFTMMRIKKLSAAVIALFSATFLLSGNPTTKTELILKTPGNDGVSYILKEVPTGNGVTEYQSSDPIPLEISAVQKPHGSGYTISVTITATHDVWFNFKQSISAGNALHNDCQFYMPGFWYRRNLRSPKEAPSFHTSDSWLVREDRLSTPLTSILNETTGNYYSILRKDAFTTDAYTPHTHGEVILSGETSIGFTGFENIDGKAFLSYGFPHREAPKSYIRKLTLAPPVTAFYKLNKGESKTIVWEFNHGKATDFSDFVAQIWNYSYKSLKPEPVKLSYSEPEIKKVLSNFWTESYVATNDLNFFSGIHLLTYECKNNGSAEIGFIGRVLLNAFFALEYAEQTNNEALKNIANSIFTSYLKNGFNKAGFLREYVEHDFKAEEEVLSIRRQSEGAYAILHYLNYEKQKGRRHPEWEAKVKILLDNFIKLQNPDGSFPRKFDADFNLVDASGGSTPSATLPMAMASKYFRNKKYLECAVKTGDYLERELISKADYFSSTLDANCEDKEASLYAATAMYYLALNSKGKQQQKYIGLAEKAAYFALSWYYLWDVPFAQGQMLGDIGLKSRGWGNVSVENNHIDVFIFEFADVLVWLDKMNKKPDFSSFAEVIRTSMFQLLPYPGHMCGVAKTGYYPEVVQHTNWDYGKNGKGFYNDYFAPGWTVASLWEMLTAGRAEQFFSK